MPRITDSKSQKAPSSKMAPQKTMAEGKLLAGIILQGNEVILQLREEYNQPQYYRSINELFYSLYKKSPEFRKKFKTPKSSRSKKASSEILNLELQDNHGFADEQAVLTALREYATTKKNLKVKDILRQGELLSGITREENRVHLKLKPPYDNPEHYTSIGNAFFDLYNHSVEFRAKFEQPTRHYDSLLSLTLKSDHGYQNDQEIVKALQSFVDPSKRINFQEKLQKGELLAGVTLNGNQVLLILREEYNQAQYYSLINQLFFDLYRKSSEFRSKFETPKNSGFYLYKFSDNAGAKFEQLTCHDDPLISLTLKSAHGYQSDHEIVKALQGFAVTERIEEPEKNQRIQQAVIPAAVPFDVTVCPENIPTSTPLSVSETSAHMSIATALPQIAMPRSKKPKSIDPKKALAEGRLLAEVVLQDNKVILQLQEEYNQPQYYHCINKFFWDLYKKSLAFQHKFKTPQVFKHKLHNLALQDNHGFTDGQAVLTALRSYVIAKPPLKIREALHQGKLLSSITCQGNNVHLKLKPAYDQPEKYGAINKAFTDLYSRSVDFKAKFEKPSRCSNYLMWLTLKNDHGYKSDQEIMKALQHFAAPSKRINFREKLRQGELLKGVTLNGNHALLTLSETYNNPNNYLLIRKMFYKLHHDSTAFAEKFVLPLQNDQPPALTLNDNHGYEDGNAILAALKNFAALKKDLKIKRALAKDKLLAGVTFNGSYVDLKLHDAYNKPEHYLSINQAFYQLYNCEEAFQAKFERPTVSYDHPRLILKPNHGYKDEAEILAALKGLAESFLDTDKVSSDDEMPQVDSPSADFDAYSGTSVALSLAPAEQETAASSMQLELSAPINPPITMLYDQMSSAQLNQAISNPPIRMGYPQITSVHSNQEAPSQDKTASPELAPARPTNRRRKFNFIFYKQ